VITRPLPRQRRSNAGVWLVVAGALLVAPHLGGISVTVPGSPAPHGKSRVAAAPPPAPAGMAARAVAYARRQLGKPYVWGDEGPGSFDCSGLTWAAWQHAGLSWSRMTAANQWYTLRGQALGRGALKPGDLVFYAYNAGDWRSIHHVGLYIGSGWMVEAPYSGALVRQVPLRTRGWFGAARPSAGGGR
jgi:cell wall-associated NlpC family hydrolase